MQIQEQGQLKLNQAEQTHRAWAEAVEVAIQRLADINTNRADTDENELTSAEKETMERAVTKAEQAACQPYEMPLLASGALTLTFKLSSANTVCVCHAGPQRSASWYACGVSSSEGGERYV